MPKTEKRKDAALKALEQRREESAEKEQIDNSSLPAGSPMYFYCVSCGVNHATLPETYSTPPSRLCAECKALKERGWLE